MKRYRILLKALLLAALMTACKEKTKTKTQKNPTNFGADVAFLSKSQKVTVLQNKEQNAKIAVIGAYQGRVMTSTANGDEGMSYGWINYDLIRKGVLQEHINVFGGENRFWMGPEGGQYAIFFAKGASFKGSDWYTPKSLDTEPFDLLMEDGRSAVFGRKIKLTNYTGTAFDVSVKRTVSVSETAAIARGLGVEIPNGVKVVGYLTQDELTNQGADWQKDKGLLSIWILGMYKPSPSTVVILPYRGDLKLNTAYFGSVNADRLQVTPEAVFFKGDGGYRSKLGLPPENAKPVIGSYSPSQNLLTIVSYSFNEGDTDYVNSLWKMQAHPYRGDVVNTYNDGPMEDGTILGPFYELESSSPAKVLKTGETVVHKHHTFHFEGNKAQLDQISQAVLGVDLDKIPAFEE